MSMYNEGTRRRRKGERKRGAGISGNRKENIKMTREGTLMLVVADGERRRERELSVGYDSELLVLLPLSSLV